MTKPVANVDITTETFRSWVDRTNQLADAMSNIVLTTNAPVTGNCTVNGSLNVLSISVDSLKSNSSNTVNIDSELVFGVKPILPAASIGANELISNSVTEIKIASNAVTNNKIADNAVTSTKIADSAVTSAKIAAGSIDETKIADSAVGTLKITDNSITTVKIADNAVSTSKISSNAITENKLASGAVTETKIVDSAITTAKLADDAVTPTKLDNTGNFTVNGITAKSIKASEQSSTQEGGRYNIAPPPSATSIDTSYIPFMDLWCDTSGDTFWRFVYKDTGGTIRNITLPLSTSGAAEQIWTDKTFDDRIATLTANPAPTGTESVACDDGKKVTLQAIADLNGNWDWESGWIAYDDTTTPYGYVAAHGLGVTPTNFAVVFECVVADGGFSPGDRIKTAGGEGYAVWTAFYADATNIGFILSNGILDGIYNNGSTYWLHATNWKAKFFAKK